MANNDAENLHGMKLDGYYIQERIEVYRTDEGGRRIETIDIDYFRDAKVAAAWAQGQTDANYCKTGKVMVISNGERHFLFQGKEVVIYDDEQARLEVRSRALNKLSVEERAVLGL